VLQEPFRRIGERGGTPHGAVGVRDGKGRKRLWASGGGKFLALRRLLRWDYAPKGEPRWGRGWVSESGRELERLGTVDGKGDKKGKGGFPGWLNLSGCEGWWMWGGRATWGGYIKTFKSGELGIRGGGGCGGGTRGEGRGGGKG